MSRLNFRICFQILSVISFANLTLSCLFSGVCYCLSCILYGYFFNSFRKIFHIDPVETFNCLDSPLTDLLGLNSSWRFTRSMVLSTTTVLVRPGGFSFIRVYRLSKFFITLVICRTSMLFASLLHSER